MTARDSAKDTEYGSMDVRKQQPSSTSPHIHTSFLYTSAAILVTVVFARYYTMSAPGLLWGDAAEFQLAAWTAGLAHPTGYPLFLILGWIWTHLLAPILPPTRAMTLLSALFGALATGVFALVLLNLLRRFFSIEKDDRAVAPYLPLSPSPLLLVLAALGALWFALTPTFWAQALVPEVYTLNALFVVVLFWLLLRLSEQAPDAAESAITHYALRITKSQNLALIALIYGLSLTHHRTMILWLPALLAFVTVDWPEWWRSGRRLLTLTGLVALPQLLYLYIPIRGPATPYLHQELGNGDVLSLYDGTLSDFVAHVTGSVFAQDLGLQMALSERAALVGELWVENVTWAGIALGIVGVVWLVRRRSWSLLALTGLGFSSIITFGIFYAIGDVEVMFIPAWLVWILWAVLGLQVIGLQIGRLKITDWVTGRSILNLQSSNLLIVAVLAGLVVWHHTTYADDLDRSGSHSARERWEEILAANPPEDAFLISNDRNEMVPLWYIQFVEGRRRDVFGIFPLITQRPEHANVVRVTESVLPYDRPHVLIKSMPGLATKFNMEPLLEPLVNVAGMATPPTKPPLESDVAAELHLNSWQATPQRIEAGAPLTVTLTWTPRYPLDHTYTTFVHLFDANGTQIAQNDHVPGGVYYPSTLWRVEEDIRDRHMLQMPAAVVKGAVEVRAGVYRRRDDTILPVGQTVRVGWLLPEDAPFEPANDADQKAQFGTSLALLAATVPERAAAGETMTMKTVWQAMAPPPDVTLFVHVIPRDTPGPPLAQYDGPAQPGYPASTWPVDTTTESTVSIQLPAELQTGEYDVVAGFYDPATGNRLQVQSGGDFVRLGTVSVR